MAIEPDHLADFTSIRRVTLRLRAGVSGFEAEPDMIAAEPLLVPTSALRGLGVDPQKLLALRVRDRGQEPMLFEDDWIVIDTADTVRRSREMYAVNWNGEACVHQLLERGGQWYVSYVNPDFKPINVRSGQFNIVGRAVYQPGRLVAGRL
jgi:phage repressor protein C with HTH and peptisase S24 domain